MIPARDCFEPFFISAAGARLRAARFEPDPVLPGRRLCALLNGQTEFIEKYFEVIDELRGRGFAVAALDWRGQGGSGRQVPGDPLKVHTGDFADYDADLAAFIAQVVVPMAGEKLPIALAHSMGGHILLAHLNRHPEDFAAVVCTAPMLMFSTRGQPRWLVRLVTETMMKGGHATDFVWGMAARDPLEMGFENQIVTSDPVRFQRTQDFLRTHPDLRTAGPTWGWVAAAYKSLAHFAARNYAEQISTPALIIGACHDRICVTDDARRFAQRMPACHYVEISGAEHEILMERDVFRTPWWGAFDDFVSRLT
jgi:lysophospholipase